MQGYSPSTYGDHIAEVFDECARPPAETSRTVDFLAGLAAGGPALELGVGTGRVAIPLAARGMEVSGVEVSRAMVERLLGKRGGDAVRLSIGDFADVDVPGRFRLVYAVFDALFHLQSQEAQVRCFRNVAQRLADGGVFVVEALVPPLPHSQRESLETASVELDHVWLFASRHDSVRQVIERQQILITEAGVRLYPVRYRYAWPAELDLMAHLAGLRLSQRWGGYEGEPFGAQSAFHVSVYGRP
jgi:SAM-dependent methyltransferase